MDQKFWYGQKGLATSSSGGFKQSRSGNRKQTYFFFGLGPKKRQKFDFGMEPKIKTLLPTCF